MFAQCGIDSWLPESNSEHPLLFPDSFYLSADNYVSDMALAPVGSRLATHLAIYGFDLATRLIISATAGLNGRCQLSMWFKDGIGEPTGNLAELIGLYELYLGEDESDSAGEHESRDGKVQNDGDIDSTMMESTARPKGDTPGSAWMPPIDRAQVHTECLPQVFGG